MKKCPECGNQVDDNLEFCPNCGCPLNDKDGCHKDNFSRNVKYCPNCGTQVPEDASFCPQCGTALSHNTQASTPVNIQSTQQIRSSNHSGQRGFGCGNGCLITFLFFIVIIILFVATCPTEQDHKAQISFNYLSYINNQAANGSLDDGIINLGANLAPGLINKYVNARFEFQNLGVLSVGIVITDDDDPLPAAVSYGFLGHVKVIIGNKEKQ